MLTTTERLDLHGEALYDIDLYKRVHCHTVV